MNALASLSVRKIGPFLIAMVRVSLDDHPGIHQEKTGSEHSRRPRSRSLGPWRPYGEAGGANRRGGLAVCLVHCSGARGETKVASMLAHIFQEVISADVCHANILYSTVCTNRKVPPINRYYQVLSARRFSFFRLLTEKLDSN